MNTDERGYFDDLTELVLGAVFEVSNTLGAGFLEKVYQRALLYELHLRGHPGRCRSLIFREPTRIVASGSTLPISSWRMRLVIELKCVERLSNEHTAQCLNYLRASGLTLCLLVNFQKPKVEWKRIVRGFQIREPMNVPPLAG